MPEDKMTGDEVAAWLRDNGKKAAWLAQTLKITPATVSRWISGKLQITGSDESLLKLLIRGEMPFEIVNEKALHGILDFTADQWRVITILATRNGTTPGKWIADKVRWILAGDEEARREITSIESHRKATSLQVLPDAEDESKVAEGK